LVSCHAALTEVIVPTRRRLAGVSLAFVAVAGFAVACGSSTNATPTSGQPSNGGGNAMASYLDCLRSNGVNLPNAGPSGRPFPTARPTARPSGAPRPSGSPGEGRRGGFPGGGFGGLFGSTAPSGVPQETWDKARQACASLQPSFNPSNRPGRDNGAFAAYRNCLSDHGVTLNGPGNGQGQQLNTADPKTAAALKACEPLRPTARPSAS
jgi:hypothetical protein